jgi:hypothetical protein
MLATIQSKTFCLPDYFKKCKLVFFPVVLHGCKTWSLKLHNKELHDLYSSPSITRMIKSRRMRWAGHVVGMGVKRNAYRLLVGKPEGKRSLGKPRC